MQKIILNKRYENKYLRYKEIIKNVPFPMTLVKREGRSTSFSSRGWFDDEDDVRQSSEGSCAAVSEELPDDWHNDASLEEETVESEIPLVETIVGGIGVSIIVRKSFNADVTLPSFIKSWVETKWT